MSLQLTLHACPARRVRAVLGVLEQHGLCCGEDDDRDDGDRDRLHLNVGYENEEHGGDADDLAADLIDAAPEAVFTCSADGTDEWMGSMVMYAPDLGTFTAPADHDHDPVFRKDEVIKALAQGFASLSARLGSPWDAAIAAHQAKGEVVAPDLFDVEWDRITGEVLIDLSAADPATAACRRALTVTPQTVLGPLGPLDAALTADVSATLARAGWALVDDSWSLVDRRGRVAVAQVYRLAPAAT